MPDEVHRVSMRDWMPVATQVAPFLLLTASSVFVSGILGIVDYQLGI